MLNHKKMAALLTSLLLCASAVMPSASFAENENESAEETTSTSAEETTDATDSEGEDIFVDDNANEVSAAVSNGDIKVSGDFSYSIMDDGNLCIEDCTSTEKDLVVPDSLDGKKVTYIGKKAFGSEPSNTYETITVPASIEYISADNPFIYCVGLKEIIVESGNSEYASEDGILYSKDKTRLLCYPVAKEGKSFAIGNSVTELGASAIFNTLLESITVPSDLELINRHAFSSNERLRSIDLSGTKLTKIGNFAFADCTSLEEVKLPDTLTDIEGGAFANCSHLKEITLNEGLAYIGQSAFANTGLTYIIVPSSVEEIGYCALGYNIDDNGTERAISDFVIVGEPYSAAHKYCTDSDTDYEYKNDFTFMTPESFEDSKELEGLEQKMEGDYIYAIVDGNAAIISCSAADAELSVPSELGGCKVTALYTTSFTNCQSTHIILPETVTEIRKGAFYGCSALASIKLPQSVKTIGEAAFGNCSVLQTVDLGGAEELGASLFEDCPMLQSITISGSCKSLGSDEPFIEYSELCEINVVGEGDGGFMSIDGVLYTKDGSALVAYPASKEGTFFKIPENVNAIAKSAFLQNKFLEEIDLSNVEEIADYAFERCVSLKKVKMSEKLKTLGPDAFYGCMELKSLRFGKNLENIGDYAFGYYYNENAEHNHEEGEEHTEGEEEGTDELIEGFTVYAPKGSVAYNYAKDNKIKVKSGTIEFSGLNISIPFLIVMGVLVIGLLIALILAATSGKRKAKKEEKKNEKAKAEAAEKIKEKKKADEKKDEEDKNEDK